MWILILISIIVPCKIAAIAAAKMLKQSNDTDQSVQNNENVHIITRVGDDAFAKLLMMNFDQSNVQYHQTSIVCPDTHTGVAPILVDQKTGDNMIVVVPGRYILDLMKHQL